MSKFMQESIATLMVGLYLALLVASFLFFSLFTFWALLILPFLICLPFLMPLMKPTLSLKKGFSSQSHLTKEEAYKILGLTLKSSPEDVIEAHRRLLALNHPDQGGSTHLIDLIHGAKNTILKDLKVDNE